jgi:hypothetical protein
MAKSPAVGSPLGRERSTTERRTALVADDDADMMIPSTRPPLYHGYSRLAFTGGLALTDDMGTQPEDGVALFHRFIVLADALGMHPDERCDILGVSVETWRQIARGTGGTDALRSAPVMRRIGYAIGLMQRTLDNRGGGENRATAGTRTDARNP